MSHFGSEQAGIGLSKGDGAPYQAPWGWTMIRLHWA